MGIQWRVAGQCTRPRANQAIVVQLLDDVAAQRDALMQDGVEVDVMPQRGVGRGGVEITLALSFLSALM